MEYYMDEKWKLSKEDRPHSSSKASMSRSVSTKSSLQKSFSTKNPFGHSSSKSSLPRSSSQRCSGFTRKCTNLAKEQKAKFYIVKRCITMLVSWKKNGDS
ncbi:small polypeptide DEVIL 13-like [Salvia miltiorrhiza]|uniref:small polypeptide DEVIL 13-like n=1 Tax=Salvia miltiorrhiza TaxID=226208 RepID=UPI0025AD3E56|nr:small polypeptide DEVIL 13-like [Salvia miltiorrhiza]